MIVAMLAGSLTALGLNAAFGQDANVIRTIGALAGALPPLSHPQFSLDTLKHLLGAAAAVTVTFAATLVMHLEFAILVGIALSLMLYLNRTSRPSIRSLIPDAADAERKFCERRPGQAECPQLKIVRIEGSLYFGAVNHVERYSHDMAERQPDRKHMLLMSKSMNFVDIAGVELLAREARRRRSLGGGLIRDPSRRGRRLPAGTIPRIVRNRNPIAWKF